MSPNVYKVNQKGLDNNVICFYLNVIYSYVLHRFPQNMKESFIGERDGGVDNTHVCIFTNLYKQTSEAI